MSSPATSLTLHDGVAIPQLGFGVWKVPAEDTQRVVEEALEAGYRHVDTAAIYRNEEGVGAALAATGVPREEIFVTTKLWNTNQAYDDALRAFGESLEKLGLERLDLFLIHWPMPEDGTFVEAWRALERLREEGAVSSIGVCNFRQSELERLGNECERLPTVNQVELHPWLQQAELREFHAEQGIATEAWSPLAAGQIFEDATVGSIAERLGRTPAQVVIRWHLQVGNVVIPKTVTPARIRENLGVFDFELGPEEMTAIAALDADVRTGPDPETFALKY